MKTGTQIIYVPPYAEGDADHPDAEAGFVTSMANADFAWCRFWSRNCPDQLALRTTDDSVLTDIAQLVERDTTAQHIVNSLIVKLYDLGGALVRG